MEENKSTEMTRMPAHNSRFNIQKQGPFQEILFGAFADIKKYDKDARAKVFRIGTLYRLNDSFIPTIKLDYPSISFCVSYNFPSNLNLMPNRFYVYNLMRQLIIKQSDPLIDLSKQANERYLPNPSVQPSSRTDRYRKSGEGVKMLQ